MVKSLPFFFLSFSSLRPSDLAIMQDAGEYRRVQALNVTVKLIYCDAVLKLHRRTAVITFRHDCARDGRTALPSALSRVI